MLKEIQINKRKPKVITVLVGQAAGFGLPRGSLNLAWYCTNAILFLACAGGGIYMDSSESIGLWPWRCMN